MTKKLYHPVEECHIELEYDIYISYERDHDITANETMHTLVTKKLYHALEECKIELEYDINISYERDHDITCKLMKLCIL